MSSLGKRVASAVLFALGVVGVFAAFIYAVQMADKFN